MKLDDREESGNVEDRRGLGKAGIAIGGVGGLIVLLVCLALGVDPQQFLGGGAPGNGQPAQTADPEEEQLAHFTKVVFGDTERVWDEQFRKMGKVYKKPKLVLFSGQVESDCGPADAAVGPFYCPGDGNVYIDLSFYRDMERKLHAGGNF